MNYKERSLYIVIKNIQQKCRDGNIKKCIEDDAKIMYKNLSGCKHISGKNKGKNIIIRGANRGGLIGACVYFACKKKKDTRSPQEIAKLFGLRYTDITKGCKTFIKLMRLAKESYEITSSKPEDFIRRFCKQLHIRKEYIEVALQITKNVQKLNIASEHTPLSIATGSILLMAELNKIPINRKQLSSNFSVSEITISKTLTKLREYSNALIDDEKTDKILKIMNKNKNKNKNIKLNTIPLKKFEFVERTEKFNKIIGRHIEIMNQTNI